MASRTPEEILAQRDAWLARKAAREAGEDVSFVPPTRPGEEPPPLEVTAMESESEPEPEPEPELVAASAAPESVATEVPVAAPPQSLDRKRTPEEIRAQREAFLAAKAARAAAPAAQPAKAAPTTQAATPAAPTAQAAPPAAKPAVAKKPAVAAAKAEAPQAASAPEVVDPNLTRREFLNYAWLASLALLTVETIGLSLWFAFPNFREGQFGGLFPIGTAANIVPEENSAPVPYTDGKFWLVNLDTEGPNGQSRTGVLAIYKVCTHLGCLYEWVPITGRFECPCHGSKFALTGDYLDGPARRSLDRFVIIATSPNGSTKETDAEGSPLVLDGDEILTIDTGRRILGAPIA